MVALYTAAYNTEDSGIITRKAGGAIAANKLVKLDSTEGQVVVCTAITDIAIGVSLQKVASGETVQVQTRGLAKIVATTTIALGAQVMVTGSGTGECSTAAGATAKSVGIAESAAGAGGADVIAVRLCVPNLNGPANA